MIICLILRSLKINNRALMTDYVYAYNIYSYISNSNVKIHIIIN